MSYGVPIYNPRVPMSSFIRFKLEGTLYESGTPDFIESFTFQRGFAGRGTFSISLADILDYDLEFKIINSINSMFDGNYAGVSFQYGHSEGSMSPWYRGFITDYTPNFKQNMNASFQLEGVSELSYGTILNRTFYLRNFGYRYSNLIKHLCEMEGWTIGEPFVSSDKLSEDVEVAATNIDVSSFIETSLIPKTKKNGNRVRFVNQCNSSGNLANLIELDFKKTRITKNEYSFVINSGNFGKVLSFTPSYSGKAFAALKTEAGYVDRVTNQFVLYKNNPNLGVDMPTKSMYLGATNIKEFNNIIQEQWANTSDTSTYSAEMEIVGDVELQPMDYVNVLPFRPDGKLHHTAGTYYVHSIEDEIAGFFKTKLSLYRIAGMKSNISHAYESGWVQS